MSIKMTKRTFVIGVAAAAAVSLAGVTTATAMGATSWGPTSATTVASAVAALTTQEQQDLAFGREEERMARDLYALLGARYGSTIFTRISAGEDHHYDAVGTLLARAVLADPSLARAAGSYANADIQRLYDQWKAQGTVSVDAAYGVGVALEQRDIADLDQMLARVTDASAKQTYTMLRAASQHHLTAFTAAKNGDTTWGTGADGHGGMGDRSGGGMGAGMGQGTGTGQGAGRGMGMHEGVTSS